MTAPEGIRMTALSTTIAPDPHEEFLRKHGMRVWKVTAPGRGRDHHWGGRCPCRRPALLGGTRPCDPCESDFTDTVLALVDRGDWDHARGSPVTVHRALARHPVTACTIPSRPTTPTTPREDTGHAPAHHRCHHPRLP